MTRIRAVFFDLDDTLVNHTAASREAAERFFESAVGRIGLRDHPLMGDPAGFARAWSEVQSIHIARYLSGELTFQEQRRARMRDSLGNGGLSDAEADELFEVYLRHYEASWRAFPDVVPGLDALGVKLLAVVTNGDPKQQVQKLEAIGLKDRFAHVVVSGAVGYPKPDARFFHQACELVGVEHHEAVHVGDSMRSDYEGARLAGLHPVWLDRFHQTAQPVAPSPSIESLIELPALIDTFQVTG